MSKSLPALLFVLAVFLLGLGWGLTAATLRLPPSPQVHDAIKTARALWDEAFAPPYWGEVAKVSDTPLPIGNRFADTPDGPAGETFLVGGGLNQFFDLCPDFGCLAVTMTSSGEITDAAPYLPDQIYAHPTVENTYESLGFDPKRNTRPIGVSAYGNGDLLVTFQAHGAVFPYGTGVGRIAPDGSPVWFRLDYAHHWAHLNPDQTAWVPTLKLGDVRAEIEAATGLDNLDCADNAQLLSAVEHLDPNGNVIASFDLIDAFLKSPFIQFVGETSDPCDWLHLNNVDVAPIDIPGIAAKGDLLLSLRNLSALAILDVKTGTIRHLVRGNFLQQHAARFLDGTHVVLFDNWGGTTGTRVNGQMPAEIVVVDLVTGGEKTLFPNPATLPEYAAIVSNRAGHIDISKDGSRLLAVFSEAGQALELDAKSGAVLAAYANLQDLSTRSGISENGRTKAILYDLFSMSFHTGSLVEH
ncbi:MAG: hypothetical protein H6873_13575 [Hyphomicrobiaceae bacterium]|nr:hypothetical protein [Hyphomicrobiaceae bacterium]